MTDKNIIPEHEPEVLAAKVLSRGSNADKVATTSVESVVVEGITLTSRYQKANELRTMTAMVTALPPHLRAMVESIFCDSKLGNCFTVELHRWTRGFAQEIGERMDRACQTESHGHSGITVRHEDQDIEIAGGADADEP